MDYLSRITRPAGGKAAVTIYARPPGTSTNDMVRALLPGKQVDKGWKYPTCYVAVHHIDRLIDGLPRPLLVSTQQSTAVMLDKGCTDPCAGAKPETRWECVCRCGGTHHAGGDVVKPTFTTERGDWVDMVYLPLPAVEAVPPVKVRPPVDRATVVALHTRLLAARGIPQHMW